MSVSCGNGKITRKEMSNLYSSDCDRNNMVKCRRNMNFGYFDTELTARKNYGF